MLYTLFLRCKLKCSCPRDVHACFKQARSTKGHPAWTQETLKLPSSLVCWCTRLKQSRLKKGESPSIAMGRRGWRKREGAAVLCHRGCISRLQQLRQALACHAEPVLECMTMRGETTVLLNPAPSQIDPRARRAAFVCPTLYLHINNNTIGRQPIQLPHYSSAFTRKDASARVINGGHNRSLASSSVNSSARRIHSIPRRGE